MGGEEVERADLRTRFARLVRNWTALVIVVISITAAFLWRIHVEERVLTETLGDDYRRYADRTKRLIPFVY